MEEQRAAQPLDEPALPEGLQVQAGGRPRLDPGRWGTRYITGTKKYYWLNLKKKITFYINNCPLKGLKEDPQV